MPLYPYRCTKCGYQFEKIQHFNSELEKKCPQCGGALERVLTVPGLQFKGSGWYVTDYAHHSSAPAGESTMPPESKPAAKPAAKPATPCGGNCGAACPAAAANTTH